MPPGSVLHVAVPAPVPGTLDYFPPAGHRADAVKPGTRVSVRLGRRRVVGLVLDNRGAARVEAHRLKPIAEVLDGEPILGPRDLQLLDWASRYYRHPLGEVMHAALPARVRRGHSASVTGPVVWSARASADPGKLSRAPRQTELLATLARHPHGMRAQELDRELGAWRRAMAGLESKGLVGQQRRPCLESTSASGPPPRRLNQAQQQAVEAVCADLGGFRAFLLEGVTGSGKTEVYLETIAQIVAAGRQALMLVPEIGLTPQLLSRARARLPGPIAVLHSALSETERHCAWHAARTGEAGVIIGTRSAVLTPLAAPGLIVVDEEHDISLKQQEGFRYHARDVGVYRARQHGIPVILGSATPSLESLFNVERGRYRRLALPERAGQALLPRLEVVDVRRRPLEDGLSAPLIDAIRAHLDADRQVLLFLNRRGYAPVIVCHACGWAALCERCDAHLTFHAHAQQLRCHHCGGAQPMPALCSACGEATPRRLGEGTERVEQALRARFPATSVVRVDRDSTRRKGELEAKLAAIQRGEYRLLIGTTMLSKGHDFPGVTLVGVVNVDQGLYSPDFRALERTAQLVVQVTGRAGRAGHPGTVMLQTHRPDHPLLGLLLRGGYAAFCEAALGERRAGGLPPYRSMALLRAQAPAQQSPSRFLEAAVGVLSAAAPAQGFDIMGPAPAPMERRQGRYRAQSLLLADSRAGLQRLLDGCLPAIAALPAARRVRWSVDVDPVEMF